MKKKLLSLVLLLLAVIGYFFIDFNLDINSITGNVVKDVTNNHITTTIQDEGDIQLYFCPQEDCESALVNFIDSAKESIHCAFFEVDLDKVRNKLLEKEKEAGIEVLVVTDNDYLYEFDHPFVKTDKFGLMHNKFCIIDGKKFSTGSMNPTNNGAKKNNNNLLLIESKVLAGNYEAEFQEMWNGTFKKGELVLNPVVRLGNATIKNYFCPEDSCANKVKQELKKAEKSIHFMTFSFTHDGIANIILLKHLDNVSVKGVMEARQVSKYSKYDVLKYQIDEKGLEKGEVIVLVTEGTRDVGYRWSAHHKEKRMYRNLETLRKSFSLLQPDLQTDLQTDMHREVTLQQFIPKDKVVAVLADHREKDNKVVKELIDMNVSVKTGQLESADYLVSGTVGVELKKVPDFVASIIDGRLLEQIRGLKQNFTKAVLIIEGDEDIYSIRKVHANAIRGMLSSIVLDFGVPVLYTKNPKDTAGLLAVMAKREQDKGGEFSYHSSKPRSVREQQEFIVSSFPGIGVVQARNLLNYFGNIKKLVNASKEELVALEGVGEKTAERLLGLFDGGYGKD